MLPEIYKFNKKESIFARTTTFRDIDGWKTIKALGQSEENKERMHTYFILDENSKNVAFITAGGELNLIDSEGKSFVVSNTFKKTKQLREAVLFAYNIIKGKTKVGGKIL
jgi:hypothetical protein